MSHAECPKCPKVSVPSVPRRNYATRSFEHISTRQEIVAKLNTEKHVRIFVFSFRKNEGMYNDRLKGLACSNRGYYSKILYFGQIEAALQRLVQVSIVIVQTTTKY